MGLFSELHTLVEEFPFTVSIIPANGLLMVLVLPHPRSTLNKSGIVPLHMTGTPAELDEEFMPILRAYRLKHIPLSQQAAVVGAEIEKSRDALKPKSQRTGAEHRHGRNKDVRGAARSPDVACPLPPPDQPDDIAFDVPRVETEASRPATDPATTAQSWVQWHRAAEPQQDMFGEIGDTP